MTRSEIIEALKQEFSHLPGTYIEKSVYEVFSCIAETLASGGRAEFRGFGAFGVKKRAPRVGRNPRTGKQVKVDAKMFPSFKCSRNLINRLNKW